MSIEKCIVIFYLVAMPLTNILVIVLGSVVLVDGQNLVNSPDTPLYGYGWANGLVTWSIVSISISVFQTFFLISLFIYLSLDSFDKERHGNFTKSAFCIVQIILIDLALVSSIIPQIDQYPNMYKATTFLFTSLLLFALLYCRILYVIVNGVSIIRKRGSDDVAENQTNPQTTTTPAYTPTIRETSV